jgi:hypothetical protein
MESTKNGTTQQYIANLMNEFNTALNKLNELKMASNDTIQVMAQIYNSSTEQKSPNQPGSVKPSFSSSASAAPSQNPFGTGIFGSSNANQPAMTASNIFGTSASTGSSFQQPSSMFSASNEQKSNFSFAQPKPSLFGQSPSMGSSIFGGAPQNQPQAPQSSSIFGQQPAAQSNIFGQNSFAPSNPAPSASIFGAQQPQQPSASIFGGTQTIQQPQAAQNVFGSFNSPQAPQQQQQQSIFGATTTGNIFQQPAQQQSPFGQIQSPQTQTVQPSSNIFGASMMTQPAPQPVPSQNVFAIQEPQNPMQQQQQQSGGSLFTIQQPTTNMPAQTFGGNPFQQQVAPSISETTYSKLEDLTPEEIQQFQAAEFSMGQIPLKPPPQNFCL